ncbi:MAG TPA: pantoate--beta-alanine ligase [Cytophagales bacterium]|nr:pantoate--beta-alanine ligase [Cytophagales bacterium]HRG07400.1 pantoate--beta-alanine ligase [Cyclobacteriaceae bacterium]
MEIFKEIASLKAFLKQFRQPGDSIGFVPTMGALHAGHLALVEASRKENTLTVCSIFVNPTQFNNPGDLAKYPNTLQHDVELLKKVGCDVLFCPTQTEMYPHQDHIRFDFGFLDKILEGEFRPGHFSGVGLVVSKLLNIVAPQRAYFGQKDFQQTMIVRKLVADLNLDVELKLVPIMREPDGLAMSSRNARLSADQRINALVFYKGLQKAKTLLLAGEEFENVKVEVKQFCESQPEIKLEYLALADSTNLSLIKSVTPQSILLIAGYAGEVRLIDNLMMNDEN